MFISKAKQLEENQCWSRASIASVCSYLQDSGIGRSKDASDWQLSYECCRIRKRIREAWKWISKIFQLNRLNDGLDWHAYNIRCFRRKNASKSDLHKWSNWRREINHYFHTWNFWCFCFITIILQTALQIRNYKITYSKSCGKVRTFFTSFRCNSTFYKTILI